MKQIVGLLVVLVLALACNRKSETSASASASALASATPEKAKLPVSRWVETLDLGKLSGANVKEPASVVNALQQRRLKKKPLLEALNGGPLYAEGSKEEQARAAKRDLKKVDSLMKEGYRLRSNPVRRLGEKVDWGANPKNDANWHYLLNSLKPWRPLVRAFERTSDQKYYRLLRSAVLDWIDYNLVRDKPNEKKWHDMGTGRRAYLLAYVLDRELRNKAAQPETVRRLVWATHQHIEFLSDPEHFVLTNHGIFMMEGLAYLLAALPEVKRHAAVRKYADQRIADLLDQQFTDDAFHTEHSPAYHGFAVRSFEKLQDQNLFKNLDQLEQILARAKSHYRELYHPNGYLVALGDSDRGKPSTERTQWLMQPSEGGYSASGTPETGKLRAYRETGYAVFRSGWGKQASLKDDFLFVGGAFRSGGHKHADHLGFEWSFKGQPILLDSGKYVYGKNRWREFFLSTRAGNAVEVDAKDYDRRPDKFPGSTLRTSGELNGLYYVSFRQQHRNFKVTQDRLFAWKPGKFLLVLDQMKSKRTHTYRQWFHFHEELELVQEGGGLTTQVPGVGKLHIRELLSDTAGKASQRGNSTANDEKQNAATELRRGETKPRIQGWLSPRYKKRLPRYSLAFRKRGAKETFVTLFSGNGPPFGIKVEETGRSIVVRFRTARGGAESYRFMPSSAEPVRPL